MQFCDARLRSESAMKMFWCQDYRVIALRQGFDLIGELVFETLEKMISVRLSRDSVFRMIVVEVFLQVGHDFTIIGIARRSS